MQENIPRTNRPADSLDRAGAAGAVLLAGMVAVNADAERQARRLRRRAGGPVVRVEPDALPECTVHVAVHDAGARGALLRAIADSAASRRFRVHGSSAGNPGDTVAEGA